MLLKVVAVAAQSEASCKSPSTQAKSGAVGVAGPVNS